MSKSNFKPIDCPKCHAIYEIEHHKNIDVKLNPEDRTRIVAGTLFASVCPKCGYEQIVTYPFVYNDPMHNFSLVYSEVVDLLVGHSIDSNSNSPERAPGKIEYGVTDYLDLITAIISLENKLNFPMVKFTLEYMQADYVARKITDGHKCSGGSIYLGGERNENGELLATMAVIIDGEEKTLACSFPMDLYNSFMEEYGTRLDKIKPFVINEKWAHGFMQSLFEEYKDDIWTFYYVADSEGKLHVCVTLNALEKILKINDPVTAYFDSKKRIKGTIIAIDHVHRLAMPLKNEEILTIDATQKEYSFICKNDKSAVLCNGYLLDDLLRFKETGKYEAESTLTENLQGADLYVAYPKDATKVCGFDEVSNIVIEGDASNNYELREVHSLIKTKKPEANLMVFTDETKLLTDDRYDYFIMKFENICRIIKADPRYTGILFNPKHEEVYFPLERIKEFSHATCMDSDSDMKKYLKSLTDEDIEAIGKQSVEFIKQIYFDKATPEDLATKYKMSKDEIGRILDDGYCNMITLLYEKL